MIGKNYGMKPVNKKPLYIFDIDGTITLSEHRAVFLEDTEDPERWNKFYDACDQDPPNQPVIDIMEALKRDGAEIIFFSGRSDRVRDKTVAWIADHTTFEEHELTEAVLTMRQHGDFTPDDYLKEDWLKAMYPEDRDRLVAAFDDRDRIVHMWRKNNVACCQVAFGGF